MLQLTSAANEAAGPIVSATQAIPAIHGRMLEISSAAVVQMMDGRSLTSAEPSL
jgi:hypothetical protein